MAMATTFACIVPPQWWSPSQLSEPVTWTSPINLPANPPLLRHSPNMPAAFGPGFLLELRPLTPALLDEVVFPRTPSALMDRPITPLPVSPSPWTQIGRAHV